MLETQTSDRVIREAHHTIEREAREKQPREHRFEKAPPQIVREHRETEVERERALRTTIDRPPRILREHTTNTSEPAGKTEPIIEVSIGRIEVRAVTATPQKQTQRTAQPMTIDDYVARRKARERR